ncbi:MAG: hypothetical protein RDU20_13695 [Desulfomonilaceae bacterium]|nr:hypothetical protein [Desulfomonilaceae bacterium]
MSTAIATNRMLTEAMKPSTEVCLTWAADKPSGFQLLLQQGFVVPVTVGSNIRAVLCDQLGVSHDYLDNRINTIFLDGKPVDDVDKATVADGSTLALSASMPGLVGAAMRKGGLIARFRGAITHTDQDSPAQGGQGTITVKLYNLVVDELGPTFLKSGISLRDEDMQVFLENRSALFWTDCKKAELNGREVDPGRLLDEKPPVPGGLVMLKVVTAA